MIPLHITDLKLTYRGFVHDIVGIWWAFLLGHRNHARLLAALHGKSDPGALAARRLALRNML